jgi:kynurenine formamidase
MHKSSTDGFPQFRQDITYSDESSLNTLEECIPRPTSRDPKQVWIIFVHGGGWQDPMIDASTFRKAQDILLKSNVIDSIAGLASINYRLSPYPSHPTDPSNPADPARNAKHPDHINDVLKAILHLQETYQFEDRYVLVGHSVGATMAFQVAMKRYWGSQYESTYALELNVVPPLAILGVNGIYDVPALVKYHRDQTMYRDFVMNALGSDESLWAAISPVAGDYDDSWPDGKLVAIAHSREDKLVEWEQVDAIHKSLKSQGWDEVNGDRRLKLIELRGNHDEVWEGGTELAKAIEATVQIVRTML